MIAESPTRADDRLDFHLENWRDWMRSGEARALKAPDHSTGFVGGGNSTTFDDMCLRADRDAAERMDAMIDSLSPAQSCAVHRRYLHAVYRFPRDNYAEQLQAACARLRAGMAGRGLV